MMRQEISVEQRAQRLLIRATRATGLSTKKLLLLGGIALLALLGITTQLCQGHFNDPNLCFTGTARLRRTRSRRLSFVPNQRVTENFRLWKDDATGIIKGNSADKPDEEESKKFNYMHNLIKDSSGVDFPGNALFKGIAVKTYLAFHKEMFVFFQKAPEVTDKARIENMEETYFIVRYVFGTCPTVNNRDQSCLFGSVKEVKAKNETEAINKFPKFWRKGWKSSKIRFYPQSGKNPAHTKKFHRRWKYLTAGEFHRKLWPMKKGKLLKYHVVGKPQMENDTKILTGNCAYFTDYSCRRLGLITSAARNLGAESYIGKLIGWNRIPNEILNPYYTKTIWKEGVPRPLGHNGEPLLPPPLVEFE